jgi:hypothetical protein
MIAKKERADFMQAGPAVFPQLELAGRVIGILRAEVLFLFNQLRAPQNRPSSLPTVNHKDISM